MFAGAYIYIGMFSEYACELTTIVLFLLSSCVYTILYRMQETVGYNSKVIGKAWTKIELK